jgi:O-antigen ligase
VVLLLALREKLGHFASVTLTTIAVLGMLALNFGAGRGLADESTSNRLQAWGAGIAFLKDSPLFGIGYGQFQDAFEITAHNSWILCAAELGLFGFFFWTGLIVFSLADLNGILKSVSRTDVKLRSSADGEAHTEAVEPSPAATDQEQQILRWARWIRLALAGFLAAAWFLSRAYVMTLYLYIGIAVALRAIAEQHSPHPEPTVTRHSIRKLALVTVGMEVVSVLFLYVIVRVRPV